MSWRRVAAALVVCAAIVVAIVTFRARDDGGSGVRFASLIGPRSTAITGDLAPLAVCPTTSATQMLCLHNYARRQHGLAQLTRQASLYASALAKVDKMIACRTFSHTPCGDAMFGSWRAENIALGFVTIRQTFQAWLESPGHRAAILDPAFRLYGSGYRLNAAAICAGCSRLWAVHFQ